MKKNNKQIKALSKVNAMMNGKSENVNGRYIMEKSIKEIDGKICIGKYKNTNVNVYCDSSIIKDYEKDIKSLCENLHMSFKCLKSHVNYKLVIGLGNSSVTETSMTLHHIYGIPYIPGQALKGCVRNYFLCKYFNIEDNTFDKCSTEFDLEQLYKGIFGDDIYGDNNEKGRVVFFDSFPINDEIIINEDVMTLHYKQYYQNLHWPTDSFNTIPIIFNTVNKDSSNKYGNDKDRFNVIFAIDNKYNPSIQKFIVNLVKETLTDHGIGAKTSVGYGYFDVED